MNEYLEGSVSDFAVNMAEAFWLQTLIGAGMLLMLALVALLVTACLLNYVMRRILVGIGHADWDEALRSHKAYVHLRRIVPALVIYLGIVWVPHAEPAVYVVQLFAKLAIIVFSLLTVSAVLRTVQDTWKGSSHVQTGSIKGFIQIAQIGLTIVGAVIIIAVIINRSPLLLVSGLGAMSAVLLLIFKDTLLSFVASVQLSSNDMLRIGDWIEMPQAGADGFVIDIALHTVKVENWDKTVTTVPTYKLFSESYRNWRTMFQSGGRRIKRTLRIDAGSIRFLTLEETQSLHRFRLLSAYLSEKQSDIAASNQALAGLDPVNQRRLTNIGTFRAYVQAYLRQHPGINQNMILLVRMLEPQTTGIPIELYCFTKSTAWVDHESVQGDIFDHLLAILPELGLRLYQAPSGADLLTLPPSAPRAAIASAKMEQGSEAL